MLRTPLALIALLPLSLATAQAADLTVSTQAVAYGDLNPLQPGDAKVLAVRLETAAQAVCEKANADTAAAPTKKAAAMQQCMDVAIAAALGQIGTRVTRTVEANLAYAKP